MADYAANAHAAEILARFIRDIVGSAIRGETRREVLGVDVIRDLVGLVADEIEGRSRSFYRLAVKWYLTN